MTLLPALLLLIQAAGEAPEAARRAGIDLGRTAFLALTLAGAIAGP